MRGDDVIVVGGGIIGLCAATAVARRGLRVVLVGEQRPGAASAAAAGMLAPSVEKSTGPAHAFACAARDLFPAYLEDLAARTGIRVPLNRLGVLQVALSERGVKGLRKAAAEGSEWLDRAELSALEPELSHAHGAVLNPGDGAVDNVLLLAALERLASILPIRRIHATAAQVGAEDEAVFVSLATGERLGAKHVVLAPGAWGGQITGASALRAVGPSRGQLVSYDPIALRHVTYGPRGYLVPRSGSDGTTIAGSTMENVGFNPETSPEGLARVRSAAEEIAPTLASRKVNAAWAGLRPVTPDMLPLLGPDAAVPRIIYACGHSRNGILMAPLTGETVAALVTEEPPTHDISAFSTARFSPTS